MDRVTRHDLKTDKFATEVTHSIEYVTSHRSQLIRYIAGAVVVVIIGIAVYWFVSSRRETRQTDLAAALRLKDAVIGSVSQPGDPRPSFASQAEKDTAIRKAYNDVISKWGGSDEASIAYYELGALAADAGQMADAEKNFRAAADAGSKEYRSVANLSLAQTLQVAGKNADAEKIYRELMASPTTLVSKEQAAFALVRMLSRTNPAEARKVLAPFEKDPRIPIARAAASLATEIPAK